MKFQEKSFEAINPLIRSAVESIVTAETFKGVIASDEVEQLMKVSGQSEVDLALTLVGLAAEYARVPLSDFRVGAIAHGGSGSLYFGANQEFEGTNIGQTIHAEQCAITNALNHGEFDITNVSVNVTPCGHCRQFMNELATAKTLKVNLPHFRKPLQEILPFSFGPDDLGITEPLGHQKAKNFVLSSDDDLEMRALKQCNKSYSPCTKNYAGVAVTTRNGDVHTGYSIENAAFNPTLPALQGAVVGIRMSGLDITDIDRAVLVQNKGSVLNQSKAFADFCDVIGCQHSFIEAEPAEE